jgi:hypothetical protein
MGRAPIFLSEEERVLARRRHWRERAERYRMRRRHISGVALSYNMVVRNLEFIDPPPAEVIAERDRALYAPQSLTAMLLGDPLPGRSALDRRGNLFARIAGPP